MSACSFLNNITVILVRPEGQTNIGSICRAMKSMGLTHLRIVDMQTPEDLTTIRTWSLSSFDIYESATHFSNLQDAIADINLVAATSRRFGKNRKFFSLTAKQFAQEVHEKEQSQSIAVVFGNEKNGLNEEEMDLCHLLIQIPTSDLYPSLNLAQAVQIVCYELFQHQEGVNNNYNITLNAQETQTLATQITEELDQIGFFAISRENGKRHLYNFWYAFIARASLSKKESHFLERMIRQLTHMKKKESLDSSKKEK